VKLAKKSSEIDLIVGGHSHDRLEKVRFEKNKNGKLVPIVQAGSHGLVVGSLMVELSDTGSLKILSYQLHEIQAPLEPDQNMVNFVAQAAENRNQYFGGRWDEIIGETLIPMSGYISGKPVLTSSCWGEHMAKMAQEASGADLAVHLAAFEGEALPPGVVRFGDITDNFPHFRNYGDPGWEITTIEVPGKILKILLKAFVNVKDQFGVNFYGVTYKSLKIPTEIPYVGGRRLVFRMRADGSKIQNDRKYRLAFPSEVAFALKESIPPAAKKVFPGLQYTGKYYWRVMEDYIRANSPIQCL
jgi:5'-nucleotidase / UDP-sugar diphosphatase